jgi:sugar-specific transcriptional regulator TrmB
MGMSQILPFSEDHIQTLVRLGLNISQAKIYLTLISLGVVNAKKICQTAKMDNAEVYRQLEALQKKGLIEKVLNFPCEYKGIPLDEALEILMKEKDEESREMRRKAKALLNVITPPIQEKDYKFSIIPSKVVNNRFLMEYKNLKEMCWYSQIERFPSCIFKYGKLWEKAIIRNNGQFRAIAELNKSADSDSFLRYIEEYKRKNPYFNCRLNRSRLLITFWIHDRNLFIFTEAAVDNGGKEILWTNNPLLVNTFKDFFELKWNNSMAEYTTD